jgi:hypothetical protein
VVSSRFRPNNGPLGNRTSVGENKASRSLSCRKHQKCEENPGKSKSDQWLISCRLGEIYSRLRRAPGPRKRFARCRQ